MSIGIVPVHHICNTAKQDWTCDVHLSYHISLVCQECLLPLVPMTNLHAMIHLHGKFQSVTCGKCGKCADTWMCKLEIEL